MNHLRYFFVIFRMLHFKKYSFVWYGLDIFIGVFFSIVFVLVAISVFVLTLLVEGGASDSVAPVVADAFGEHDVPLLLVLVVFDEVAPVLHADFAHVARVENVQVGVDHVAFALEDRVLRLPVPYHGFVGLNPLYQLATLSNLHVLGIQLFFLLLESQRTGVDQPFHDVQILVHE